MLLKILTTIWFRGQCRSAGQCIFKGTVLMVEAEAGYYLRARKGPLENSGDGLIMGIWVPLASRYDHPRLAEANDLHMKDSFLIAAVSTYTYTNTSVCI